MSHVFLATPHPHITDMRRGCLPIIEETRSLRSLGGAHHGEYCQSVSNILTPTQPINI